MAATTTEAKVLFADAPQVVAALSALEVERDAALAIATVARALRDRCSRHGDGTPRKEPWWGLSGEDGLSCYMCEGDDCDGDGEDWSRVAHEADCPALALDAALAAAMPREEE